MQPRIVTTNNELFSCYDQLRAGDIVACRIRLAQGQEHLLLDLVSRGIRLVPSATSQLCSRSKVFQATTLGRFMVQYTRSVYSIQDLLECVTEYGRLGVGAVVCKIDRANAGVGILRFSSIEDVFSQAALQRFPFPCVLQPFVAESRDVRVVVLGDIVEAYERSNPHNFRHNLHCGGTGKPWKLTSVQHDFCKQVMDRAGFIYAHVDLMILPDGTILLAEINLRGGLRGAQMSQQEYGSRIKTLIAGEVESIKKAVKAARQPLPL